MATSYYSPSDDVKAAAPSDDVKAAAPATRAIVQYAGSISNVAHVLAIISLVLVPIAWIGLIVMWNDTAVFHEDAMIPSFSYTKHADAAPYWIAAVVIAWQAAVLWVVFSAISLFAQFVGKRSE